MAMEQGEGREGVVDRVVEKVHGVSKGCRSTLVLPGCSRSYIIWETRRGYIAPI